MLLSDFARDLGPIFIRKINKRADWEGDNESVLRERLDQIQKSIFSPPTVSLYLVNNDFDFQSVTVSLSRLRENWQPFDFVWFSKVEIDNQGVQTAKTEGTTRCAHANSLHFDFAVEDWVEQICRDAISARRAAMRIPKSVLNGFASFLLGCTENQNDCSQVCDKTRTWIPAT